MRVNEDISRMSLKWSPTDKSEGISLINRFRKLNVDRQRYFSFKIKMKRVERMLLLTVCVDLCQVRVVCCLPRNNRVA